MKTCPFLRDQECKEHCQMYNTLSKQCQFAEAAETQKKTAAALEDIAKALCKT